MDSHTNNAELDNRQDCGPAVAKDNRHTAMSFAWNDFRAISELHVLFSTHRAYTVPKYRSEYIVMTGKLLLCCLLGIASLCTNVGSFQTTSVTVVVGTYRLSRCIHGMCAEDTLSRILCSNFAIAKQGMTFSTIGAILVSCAIFPFLICAILGRVFIWKELILVLTIISWIFFFIAMTFAAVLVYAKTCSDISLWALGMHVGPTFPLVLSAWLVQTLNILFFIVNRYLWPSVHPV